MTRLLDHAERLPLLGLTVAGLVATLLCRGVFDVDIFWQLRLGDLMLDAGHIPATEPFLSTAEDRPHVPLGWLSQVILAAARWLGGWGLAQVVDILVFVGGLAAVAWAVRRRVPRAWPAAVGLWVGFQVALPQSSLRPQSFALLGFGALIAVLKSGLSPWRKGLLATAVLVLWQNAHPSVVTAGAYLFAVAAAGWGRHFLAGGRRPWVETALLPICAAAVFATPAGAALLPVAAYNADISYRLNVGEWHALWDQDSQGYFAAGDWDGLHEWAYGTGRLPTAIVLVATIAVVLWRGRRVPAEDLVAAGLFAAMTLVTYRFVLFWSALVIPVWCHALAPAPPMPPAPRLVPGWRLLLAAVWVAAVVVPMALKPRVLAEYLPMTGAERMKTAGVRGVVYTDYLWGGVVTDIGYPNWKVTHDGRYYLLRPEDWDDHMAALAGKVPVEELEERFRPDAFFLRPGSDDGLIDRLRRHPRWRELYADGSCVVFVQAAARSGRESSPR